MRGEVVKLGVFFTIAALAAGYIALLLGETRRAGTETEVRAEFADVSYLEPGDPVRVAGVRVGQVEDLRMRPDATVLVTMTVSGAPPLTTGTRAAVKYRDLVGNRYLELAEGDGGAPLGEAVIPLQRTAPALDLDVLVGGFQPLFRALSPEQVNQLSGSLIQVLQGEAGALDSFLTSLASVTHALADRDRLIGDVIGNLDAALATFDAHDRQVSEVIGQTRRLVDGLAADRGSITGAVDHLHGLTATTADLLPRLRPDLRAEIGDLRTIAGTLNAHDEDVRSALRELPEAYRRIGRIGVNGNFFNAYLCSVRVRTSTPTGGYLYTPWIDSDVRRCAEEGGN
ncbi:MlaD family protein [Saccharopolyspora sp. TS4A08]|uniref:MlaD family protein n=1 Tax=Saccharopolyspora ipomoeae TaxID=3042027 RepID=A0ABT6PGQ2_9PSEU|nr:MlaD family protein [Saccharopolyspora sp. TS4A08]MDI2027149.1 MlaD family protein [Saccharopolyspora sp. TS4A08]